MIQLDISQYRSITVRYIYVLCTVNLYMPILYHVADELIKKQLYREVIFWNQNIGYLMSA